jgi:hypothetical protein
MLEFKPANCDGNNTQTARVRNQCHSWIKQQNLDREGSANSLSFSFYVFVEINVRFTIQDKSRDLHRKRPVQLDCLKEME